jgi:hypothetical protein
MRRVLGALSGAMLAAAFAACGFDLAGSLDLAPSAADGAAPTPTGGDRDGEVADGGGEASALPEIPVGPGSELPIEDAGADAIGDCGSPIIADNFNAGIGPTWLTYGTTAPATETGGNGYVRLIPTGQAGSFAGIFTRLQFAATSFVATFRYFAQQPYGFGNIGDGITMTWITSGTVTPAALADSASGGGLGIPRGLGGYAFALDAFRNSTIGDPSAPSFSLLHIEPAKGAPGFYDWHVQNDGPYTGVYDGWRTVTVTFAKGKLSADVNGTKLFQNVAIPAANILAVGFTASTGGADAIGFNVDTVRIELTDAVCH